MNSSVFLLLSFWISKKNMVHGTNAVALKAESKPSISAFHLEAIEATLLSLTRTVGGLG